MPIQPNDMLTIGLPAVYWDWLLAAARAAPAPHQESDPVIQALNGQMRQHVARAKAADDLAAAAAEAKPEPEAPADPPPPPPPSRAERRRAVAAAKKEKK